MPGVQVRNPRPEAKSQTSEALLHVEAPASDQLTSELLDPRAWQESLEQYARAMHLAVALVDAHGRLRGGCLNPRPLWSLLRARLPAAAGACPFAVAPVEPCTCIADALQSGVVSHARDRSGLIHFAVPLVLDDQKFGVLIAGQVFDQYPEQLPLEQMAKKSGLPAAKVWQTARLEHPFSSSMVRVYEDLLVTLGRSFLQGRYHMLLEASRVAQLARAEEALRQANNELERRVEERTAALHEALQKVLQAERLAAIGQMVAGLAHESRNALQRSQACLALLELRMQDRPDVLDLLRRLQKAQDDLHRLFNDVRDYAAPVRLDLCVCDLAQVWWEAWADLAALRNARQAELREETGDTDLGCVASPFHLRQIFRNLLDNALSAGGDPIRVVIRCSPTEIAGAPGVQIAVRDNGPGLSDEQRQKMFEPFFTTKPQGTGLGLAICRRLVEAHGGRIALGEGATSGAEVLVTLPRGRQ